MKWYYWLIAILIILLVFAAGFNRGRSLARQECIDKVSENCEYICGVGRDFYYPDQEEPAERLQDLEEYDSDSTIAWRLSYGKKSN